MLIKSAQALVEEALKEIKTINTDDAYKLVKENKCNLIDVRDIRELEREGRVENSNHIPRGMLEFWLDPESIYFKDGKFVKSVANRFVMFPANMEHGTQTHTDVNFRIVLNFVWY